MYLMLTLYNNVSLAEEEEKILNNLDGMDFDES